MDFPSIRGSSSPPVPYSPWKSWLAYPFPSSWCPKLVPPPVSLASRHPPMAQCRFSSPCPPLPVAVDVLWHSPFGATSPAHNRYIAQSFLALAYTQHLFLCHSVPLRFRLCAPPSGFPSSSGWSHLLGYAMPCLHSHWHSPSPHLHIFLYLSVATWFGRCWTALVFPDCGCPCTVSDR